MEPEDEEEQETLDCGFGIHFPGCRQYPAIRTQFLEHVESWKEGTGYKSRLDFEHSAYQAIISMGPQAIITILEEMRLRPNWFFYAIEQILQNNQPIHPLIPKKGPTYPPGSDGRLRILTNACLDWGSDARLCDPPMEYGRDGLPKQWIRSLSEMIGFYIRPLDTTAKYCQALYHDNAKIFAEAQGSSHNHQAWPGGYEEHVKQVMNIGVAYYQTLSKFRDLPFSLNDAMLVLYLHDIEKPWKKIHPEHFTSKAARSAFRLSKIAAYGITLNGEQENALKYVEGEGDDYRSDARTMNEMAAFCHVCDVTSARIWHDWRTLS